MHAQPRSRYNVNIDLPGSRKVIFYDSLHALYTSENYKAKN